MDSSPKLQLWRDMQFAERGRAWRREFLGRDPEPRRSPDPEQLKKMLSWAGDGGARKIVTPENMIITQSLLTLLLDESPCLEYLKIGNLRSEILFPTNGKTWNRLRNFCLERGFYGSLYETPVDGPGGFPCSFLQDAASSLEHLDFTGIPLEWYGSEPFIPFLPKLKTLRINGSDDKRFPFSIYPLSVAFPRLEQLDIGPDIPCFNPEPVSVWRDQREDIWPHLKVLIFQIMLPRYAGPDTARTRSALRFLTCINRGNSLQHLVLELCWACPEIDIFSGIDDLLPDFDIVQDSEFRNLRSFRSSNLSISPEGARNLLSKALQTNQLASFDIVFPLSFYDNHVEHLRGYDWARGATSIQSLGLYALQIDGPPDKLNDQDDHFVARFLATFPNLRTLSISCEFDDEADYASFLLQILRLTHLETMYMRLVDEKACAQVRQAARDKGVQLIEISDPPQIPRPWSKAWLESGGAW
ncbi:hypothetical protein E4U11_001724 [Claviceps purpurea]|nr:hypothetical protein E4U11_001724 [Claviceps purpurea]